MGSPTSRPSTTTPPRPTLPAQVSPPEFALSAHAPHAIVGVECVALPVLPDPDRDGVLLGPGAEELADQLGVDLFALLELDGATGKTGEVTRYPVPLGGPDNPALRLVLLVGVGEQRPVDLRRAGAALARALLRPGQRGDLDRHGGAR